MFLVKYFVTFSRNHISEWIMSSSNKASTGNGRPALRRSKREFPGHRAPVLFDPCETGRNWREPPNVVHLQREISSVEDSSVVTVDPAISSPPGTAVRPPSNCPPGPAARPPSRPSNCPPVPAARQSSGSSTAEETPDAPGDDRSCSSSTYRRYQAYFDKWCPVKRRKVSPSAAVGDGGFKEASSVVATPPRSWNGKIYSQVPHAANQTAAGPKEEEEEDSDATEEILSPEVCVDTTAVKGTLLKEWVTDMIPGSMLCEKRRGRCGYDPEEAAAIKSWRCEVEYHLKSETKKKMVNGGLATKKLGKVGVVVNWPDIEKMLPPRFYAVMDPAAVAKEMVKQSKW